MADFKGPGQWRSKAEAAQQGRSSSGSAAPSTVDTASLSAEDWITLMMTKGNVGDDPDYAHLKMSPEQFDGLFGGGTPEPAPVAAAAGTPRPPIADFPEPPQPRTDLPTPEGMSDEDFQQVIALATESGPDEWRAADGTLYMKHTPSELAPGDMMVDSPCILGVDDPLYPEYVRRVHPLFDFFGTDAQSAPAPQEPTDA